MQSAGTTEAVRRPMNDQNYVYQPKPIELRLEQAMRALERFNAREHNRRRTLMSWLREREKEDTNELRGMVGGGSDLYAITRRIELEARLQAWKAAISQIKTSERPRQEWER